MIASEQIIHDAKSMKYDVRMPRLFQWSQPQMRKMNPTNNEKTK